MWLLFKKFLCVKKIFLSLGLLVFLGQTICAQKIHVEPFVLTDTLKLYNLAVNHQNTVKNSLLGTAAEFNLNNLKQYQQVVQYSAREAFNSIRYSALLDTIIYPYVQGVLQQIILKNENLPPVKVFLTKSPVENAYAWPDGTILFNVGLLAKLENESQLAFILCHELAHVYLKHPQTGIRQQIETINNKTTRKEYQKIYKEEYNVRSKLDAFRLRLQANNSYQSRIQEKQADSLGFVFLSKTSYDKAAAYTALQVLDKIDQPFSNENIDLGKYFNCNDHPLVIKGEKKITSSIFTIDPGLEEKVSLSDTLKTHPNCQKRLQYIKILSSIDFLSYKDNTGKNYEFEKIKVVSRFEAIQGYFDLGKFDKAFYNALLLLKEKPHHSYLQNIVIICLYQFNKHLLAHDFAQIISATSEQNAANFNQVLSFLHQIRVSDFKGLSTCFNGFMAAPILDTEYSLAARYSAAALNQDVVASDKLREEYLVKYPTGRLANILFP